MITQSESETVAAGRNLAATLQPGDIVLLSGALGAGKTAFVRGIAEGLGANPNEVTSPTFTLIQEYRGRRCTLYHVDLYRLEPREVDDLGLDELLAQEGITAIEWPERLPRRLEVAIEVLIFYTGETRREIVVTRGEAAQPD
ncbi:MAG TPA: tRNA (adenosine(37)-N6)-threonylcarbamoyltransferase complex ATPase subunit type 1 TsaE [Vicinamibacterales bacterium]|nr:tRNA (adenosine(37)-N6)-threonylcarbamoyltransferase complex ATPase subunit type 1 TsaE [Vicinamibacterales bacterium]